MLAVAILGLLAGCYRGCDVCIAQTEDDLRAAAASEACSELLVRQTDLTTLTGLEEISHPMRLTLSRNAVLADVSAVQRLAGTVEIDSNPSLVNAQFGVVGGVWLSDGEYADFPEPRLEELSLIAGDVLVGLGSPGEQPAMVTRVSVTQNDENGASVRRISVGCDEPCLPLSLYLEAAAGFTTELVLDGVGYDQLFVQANDLRLEDLQRLLVPASKVEVGVATRQVAEEYLAWLQSEGFAGQFVACVFDSGVGPPACEDRIVFP